MLDAILNNLDGIAAKTGLPAEQVKAIAESVTGAMASGGNPMTALAEAAQAQGLSLESLQGMMAGFGVNSEDVMGKLGGLLDRDGDGNPLNDLGGLTKGLFG